MGRAEKMQKRGGEKRRKKERKTDPGLAKALHAPAQSRHISRCPPINKLSLDCLKRGGAIHLKLGLCLRQFENLN